MSRALVAGIAYGVIVYAHLVKPVYVHLVKPVFVRPAKPVYVGPAKPALRCPVGSRWRRDSGAANGIADFLDYGPKTSTVKAPVGRLVGHGSVPSEQKQGRPRQVRAVSRSQR